MMAKEVKTQSAKGMKQGQSTKDEGQNWSSAACGA
jgi:hypothetical protein